MTVLSALAFEKQLVLYLALLRHLLELRLDKEVTNIKVPFVCLSVCVFVLIFTHIGVVKF